MPKDTEASLAFALADLAPGEFSKRKDEAGRRGEPAWLWPEVTPERWMRAMRDIAGAAEAVLAGEPACLASDDCMALSLGCYTAGVGPLFGSWFEQGLLGASQETAALLQLHLCNARERTIRTTDHSRKVVANLFKSGISAVVLKGGHTAIAHFPEPATRPSADLDLLVPASRRCDAEAALEKAGLECVGKSTRDSTWIPTGTAREPRSLWLVRSDDPWSVDLHHSLDFEAAAGVRLVKFDMAEPFSSTDPWPLDDKARALRRPLLLLHLAVHAGGSLQNLTLLRMIEIILVVRRDLRSDPGAWFEFEKIAIRTNGLAMAFPALHMCERLAPGTVPQGVLKSSARLAPRRVRAIVGKLDPATVQRVDRASIGEHFMWSTGLKGWLSQVRSDIAPKRTSMQSVWSIYKARANRLRRGRITR